MGGPIKIIWEALCCFVGAALIVGLMGLIFQVAEVIISVGFALAQMPLYAWAIIALLGLGGCWGYVSWGGWHRGKSAPIRPVLSPPSPPSLPGVTAPVATRRITTVLVTEYCECCGSPMIALQCDLCGWWRT